MATLDDLLQSSLASGMMTPEQQAARVQQSVAAAAPEMLRKYGATSQQIAENSFGRGLGLSSYAAYQQALNTLMQNEGAAKIQNDAQNNVDAAQRAAVGNAASYASAEKNRAVQQATANQANQTMRRGQNMVQSGQTQGQIFQGLAGLAGGAGGLLGKEFKPEIGAGLRAGYNKLFGGGTPAEQKPVTEQAPNLSATGAAGASEMANNPGAYNAPTAPSYSQGQGLDLGGAASTGPAYGGGYSFSDMTPYSYSSYGWDPSQFDLTALFNGQDSTYGGGGF